MSCLRNPRQRRAWTPAERALLAAHAPQGIDALRRALPGRVTNSIRGRARIDNIAIARGGHGGFRTQDRWRGRLPVPRHCHPLVRRFIEEANRQQAHLGEIAARIGSTRDMLSDWRYRRMPRLDNFEAALNALGLRLAIVSRGEGE